MCHRVRLPCQNTSGGGVLKTQVWKRSLADVHRGVGTRWRSEQTREISRLCASRKARPGALRTAKCLTSKLTNGSNFSPNGSPRTFPPSDRQQRAPDTHINSFSSGPNLVLHSTALQCHSFFFVVFFFTILERGKKKKTLLKKKKTKIQKHSRK